MEDASLCVWLPQRSGMGLCEWSKLLVLPMPTQQGREGSARFRAAQPPRQFYLSEALGFRNAFLLLNSSKASQQKFPFLSFTYMSFFPEKQVTDWI